MDYKIIKVDRPNTEDGIRDYRNHILALWANNLSNCSLDRFSWLYSKNPAGEVMTWLAITGDTGDVVGCNSVCPRDVFLRNKRIKMGVAVDFAVNINHRVFGPAIKMQKHALDAIQRSAFNIVFAWPNAKSEGIFIRAGYGVIGTATAWVKLLKTKNKIITVVKTAFIARTIATIIDGLLGLIDHIHVLLIRRKYMTQILSSCDSRFDDLWKNSTIKPNIVGERTSDFLNWRYSASNIEQYLFYCVFNAEQSALLGYVVYSLTDNIAYVWDVFALDRNAITLVLIKFSQQMRNGQANSISINYMGAQWFDNILHRLNFIKRESSRRCLAYVNRGISDDDESCVYDPECWFMFEGDMDL